MCTVYYNIYTHIRLIVTYIFICLIVHPYVYRFDLDGKPFKAPWFRYKNSTKQLRRSISHLSIPQYLEALKEQFESDDDTSESAPSTSTSLPSLSVEKLEQYRHNPDKLSIVTQIYHDLLCDTKIFDVNPICCSDNDGDETCELIKRAPFTWKNFYLTMSGIYKLQCYNKYCTVHDRYVKRNLLLQLCVDALGYSTYKSGHMTTSLGMKLFIQNLYMLQTNVSLVTNILNIHLLSVINDRIALWKSTATQHEINLLSDILNEVTDDESKQALDLLLVKRQQITNYCHGLSNNVVQIAHKLFKDSLITDCRIIENTVVCQINGDATFDAAINTTNNGVDLRSVVAGFCSNKAKVVYPPTFARSENTMLFVTVLSTLCCQVINHYAVEKGMVNFRFIFCLDDTKSYVNLPNQVLTKIEQNLNIDFEQINCTILLAEDRMHRVGRYYRQVPKVMHQWGLFLRCISAHHARAEKGILTLTENTTMTVDEYISAYEHVWIPHYETARNDLCRLIQTITKIEDSKFRYNDEEYICALQCKHLFQHAIDKLGWLASSFFARQILFKDCVDSKYLNVKIEFLNSNKKYITSYACALPTYIFLKLVKKSGRHLQLMCWQSDEHCFWGFMNIYQLSREIWSDYDSAPMSTKHGFMKRLALDTEPLAIRHLMNNRYNTSAKSGTAVSIERLHGYYNSHNVKVGKGTIENNENKLNLQAYKKTKIAIYDEEYEKNTHSSQWHQVTVLDARKELIKALSSPNSIQIPNKTPYRNRKEQIKEQKITIQHTAKKDRKRRWNIFNNNNEDQHDDNISLHPT